MPYGDTTSDEIERVAHEIVDASFKVHRTLGPGLLESVYQVCLQYELERRGLKVEREVPVPVVYEGVRLETGFRLDLLVERLVIVEVKAVEKMIPLFDAKALTYLTLANHRLCLLINFNVKLLKDDLRRIVL